MLKIDKTVFKTRETILFILLFCAYVSISLFQIALTLFLIWEIYLFIKRQIKLSGIFKWPIVFVIFSTETSTLLYGRFKDFLDSLGMIFYNIAYFAKDAFTPSKTLFYNLNRFIVFFTGIEFIVTGYNVFVKHIEQPIWGGVFEIGVIFSLGSISALILFIVEEDKKYKFLYIVLFVSFSSFLFIAAKRNPLLGFSGSLFLVFYYFIRFKQVDRKYIISGVVVVLSIFIFGTVYAFHKFPKYKIILNAIVQKKPLTEEQLNRFSSSRWMIGKKGLQVIKKDIENKNIIPLLIGHGYASGYYLTPKSPVGRTYESVFLISEFIQKGLIGLIGVILMMIFYFKFVFKVRIKEISDFYAVTFLVFPAYFLIGGIFSGIWDAVLPLYLLLFGISENYFRERNES